MTNRKLRDITGSYTGQLVETKDDNTVGLKQQLKGTDLVIKVDAGKLLLDYKGSKRELPAVDVLQKSSRVVIRFPIVEDGRTLRTLLVDAKKADEIDVTAELKTRQSSYTIKGTLTKTPKP
jgi:hypothetical protein